MNYLAYGIGLLFGLALGFMAMTLWIAGGKAEKAIAAIGAIVAFVCFIAYPLVLGGV